MKRHLVFCCTSGCKKVEMRKVIANAPPDCQVLSDRVRIGEDEYIFFVDVNRNSERIRGYIVDSFRCCDEYQISNEIRHYVESHNPKSIGDKSGVYLKKCLHCGTFVKRERWVKKTMPQKVFPC